MTEWRTGNDRIGGAFPDVLVYKEDSVALGGNFCGFLPDENSKFAINEGRSRLSDVPRCQGQSQQPELGYRNQSPLQVSL